MSSEQGPHVVGMGASAIAVSGRHGSREGSTPGKEATLMSSEQGPRMTGMGASAIAVSGRHGITAILAVK